MARCCGSTGTCACKLEAGRNINISGMGTSQDPFVIASNIALAVEDTAVVDLTLTGSGTLDNPWVLSARYSAGARLDDLPDVSANAPANGQVLAWNASAQAWQPSAPATATPGGISHDTSLTGDGSVGAPLEVRENTLRYLATTASGLGLSDGGVNLLVRKFADDTERAAASPAPALNTISVLGSAPGQLDYWDGSAWVAISNGTSVVTDGDQLLSLSGAYTGGATYSYVKELSVEADVNGVFDVLSAVELDGYAGVLAVQVQPMGAVAWVPMVNVGTDSVTCTAHRLSTGLPYSGAVITASVSALLY